MRYKLIEDLADQWRDAENQVLETDGEDDSLKWETIEKIKKAKLSPAEQEELDALIDSYGC